MGTILDQPDALHPITRAILQAGQAVTGPALFQAQHRLAALRRETEAAWQSVDLLLLPTTGTAYSLQQVEAEPVLRNTELGHYTNFANLLDLAAIAVPSGFTRNGFPIGVTLVGPAWSDPILAAIAHRMHQAARLPLGASGVSADRTSIAVFGAHMEGQPLNGALQAMGGRFVRACRTAPVYRMLALPGPLPRPALVRGGGAALEGEVWSLPSHAVAAFLGSIASPLGLGTVELDDGPTLGFIAEAGATGEDITGHGGWRNWIASGTRVA